MYKFANLIVKNLGRSKIRTTITCLAVLILVSIYSVISTVVGFVDDLVSNVKGQMRLIVSERWVIPSRFPVRYVSRVAAVPGVADWTVWHFYYGYLDESRRFSRFAGGLATRIDNLAAMHDGLEGLDPQSLEAVRRDKSGALVGSEIMQKMNWQVGQQFTLLSTSHPRRDLRFRIAGVPPPGRWSGTFFFREDYFQQATGDDDSAIVVWLRVDVGLADSVIPAFSARKVKVSDVFANLA